MTNDDGSKLIFVICGLHHVVSIYFDLVKISGNSFVFVEHYVKSLRRDSPEFLPSLFSSALNISVAYVAGTVTVAEISMQVLRFTFVSVILCSNFARLPTVLYKLKN